MAVRDRVPVDDDDFEPVKVHLRPHEGTGEIPILEDDAMRLAGWSADPGQGKAILTHDGREVLNPVPMAPPVGYVPQPTLMELIDQMVHRHLHGLKGDDEVDSMEEVDDFDVDEEMDPNSIYELVDMVPEAPALPKASLVSEPPPAGGTSGSAPDPKPEVSNTPD